MTQTFRHMIHKTLFFAFFTLAGFGLSAQSVPTWAVAGQTQVYEFGPRGNQVYRSVFTNKTDGAELDSLTFKVYPNPASRVLNIELEDQMVMNFKIYTMDGRFVEDVLVNSSKTLDLSKYSNGKYFLVPMLEDTAGEYISFIVLK